MSVSFFEQMTLNQLISRLACIGTSLSGQYASINIHCYHGCSVHVFANHDGKHRMLRTRSSVLTQAKWPGRGQQQHSVVHLCGHRREPIGYLFAVMGLAVNNTDRLGMFVEACINGWMADQLDGRYLVLTQLSCGSSTAIQTSGRLILSWCTRMRGGYRVVPWTWQY